MKTDDDIYKAMDEAEQEIESILAKHGLGIGMLYDEGVGIVLTHQQQHPNGDCSMREREAF